MADDRRGPFVIGTAPGLDGTEKTSRHGDPPSSSAGDGGLLESLRYEMS
jgi:hypothetical protein